jgi:hypothetical protein
MCNLYSITRNREAILRLYRVSRNHAAPYDPREAILRRYGARTGLPTDDLIVSKMRKPNVTYLSSETILK